MQLLFFRAGLALLLLQLQLWLDYYNSAAAVSASISASGGGHTGGPHSEPSETDRNWTFEPREEAW